MFNAYDAWKIFMGIKLHFSNDSYDYFKYFGKFKNMDVEHFNKRQDRFWFEYLVANFSFKDKEELERAFVVFYHLSNGNFYIKDFVNWYKKNDEYWKKYLAFIENPCLILEKDLALINVDSKYYGTPLYFFKFYINKNILIETFLVLNYSLNIVKELKKDFNPVVEKELKFIKKYVPFSPLKKFEADVLSKMVSMTKDWHEKNIFLFFN